MSNTSKYFANKAGLKRKPSSTSSASDTGASPDFRGRSTHDKKKQRQISSESIGDMDLEETLKDMNSQLLEVRNTLASLATKDDIQSIRDEMGKISTQLTNRIDKLECSVMDLSNEKDKLCGEVEKLRKENEELRSQATQSSKASSDLRKDVNDQEQHGRQWSVRVFGVKESQGETVDDCVQKCADLFTKKLGVTVKKDDIEIAHRAGQPGGSRPRPILARFFSRRLRSQVLGNRRKLKGSGVSIGEDLTPLNYKLLKRASDHSASMASWSSNGKILTKLKNGKTMKLDIDMKINEVFSKAMSK